MDRGESLKISRAWLKIFTDVIPGTPTLESMPVEILLEIMRLFLKSPGHIYLDPENTYTDSSWGFGSLGVLRVSKHLSAIGLSVLYGENDFWIQQSEYELLESDESWNDEVWGRRVSSPLWVPVIT